MEEDAARCPSARAVAHRHAAARLDAQRLFEKLERPRLAEDF
jgi:hypothetical protein